MMGEVEGGGSSNGAPPLSAAAAATASDPTAAAGAARQRLKLPQHLQHLHHPAEADDDPDVSPREREHIGEIGRHYKPFSKRHGVCLALFALALACCDNGRVGYVHVHTSWV